MSTNEPTIITHAFVPTGTKRTAWYLVRATEDRIYGHEVIGALIQHVIEDGQVVESETKLAYLEGVDVTELSDGPMLVGVYRGDDRPPAADIEVARINWALYLRTNALESEAKRELRELQKAHEEQAQGATLDERERLTRTVQAKAGEIRARLREAVYAARVEAAEQEKAAQEPAPALRQVATG